MSKYCLTKYGFIGLVWSNHIEEKEVVLIPLSEEDNSGKYNTELNPRTVNYEDILCEDSNVSICKLMKSKYKEQIEDSNKQTYQENLSIIDKAACENLGYYGCND